MEMAICVSAVVKMKSKLFPLIFLSTFLFSYVDSNGRIHGGYQIDITKAPYVVYIAIVKERLPDGKVAINDCSGSILRKNLILTAAHCNINDNQQIISAADCLVNVGTNNKDLTGGTIHYVKTVFVHPKYKGGGHHHFFHDVGLLELKEDIPLSDRAQLVQLALPSDWPVIGTDGTVTGFGYNPDHLDDIRLYQVHLNVITAEQCVMESAGGTAEEVNQHQICAEAEGKGGCPGDSGGPFHDVSTNRQIGTVSYGKTNCTLPQPNIFCRVTDNLGFINEVIEKTTPKIFNALNPSQINLRSSISILDMFKPSSWIRS